METQDQLNYKREYTATHVMVKLPDDAFTSEEEERCLRDGWDAPMDIVLDTGKTVWVSGCYSHGLPKGVVQVECAGEKFDRAGNCILSVPADWCAFYTADEAHGIEQCMEADARLLSYAR
jgi:hypothetical protein